MRTKVIFLAVMLFSIIMAGFASDKKGNGKLITRNITVSDYNEIEIKGSCINSDNSFNKLWGNLKSSENDSPQLFNYTQSSNAASLTVTIDENLFSELNIRVAENKLVIDTKNNSRITPTRLFIEGNSSLLKSVHIFGPLDFRVKGTFKADDLSLKITGSGDIELKESLKVLNLITEVVGSGDITIEKLTCNDINARVSGSGDIFLAGKAQQGTYTVAGSGDIKAYDLNVENLKCSVAGSGDIKANASGTLDASVAGSGDIEYRGNASVNTSVAGSGDIERAD